MRVSSRWPPPTSAPRPDRLLPAAGRCLLVAAGCMLLPRVARCCHSERSEESPSSRQRGLSTATTAIPRLRRFAAPLGMTIPPSAVCRSALRDFAPFGISRSSEFSALRNSALFGIQRSSASRAVRPFALLQAARALTRRLPRPLHDRSSRTPAAPHTRPHDLRWTDSPESDPAASQCSADACSATAPTT
jgi:hypothetical protein